MMSENQLKSRHRQPDGFASLTADIMKRRPGAPSGNASMAKLAPAREAGFGTRVLSAEMSDAPLHPLVYDGPERRKREISPVTERRQSVLPRVKMSVRLEQPRHKRLKGAAILLNRTYQDLMTSALDHYLESLGMPEYCATPADPSPQA